MSAVEISVRFSDHLSEKDVEGMLGGIMALGDVVSGSDRSYRVVVRRAGKLRYAREMLEQWDLHGFVRWSETH